ncbi:MAG: hypothetical protein UU47_C0001G0082 [candidate division TM6 bacterium GW2011_GWE2_41_16]|nr:MAG: hypothetical protein UU47_C0001G0082 [candidate division TM6 bacterium GW2011_GWE2_41_16]
MNKFTQFSLAAVALLLTGGVIHCSDIIVNVDNQKKQAAKIEIDAHGLGIKNHMTMVPGMKKAEIKIPASDLAVIRVYEEENPNKFALKHAMPFPWKAGDQKASTFYVLIHSSGVVGTSEPVQINAPEPNKSTKPDKPLINDQRPRCDMKQIAMGTVQADYNRECRKAQADWDKKYGMVVHGNLDDVKITINPEVHHMGPGLIRGGN